MLTAKPHRLIGIVNSCSRETVILQALAKLQLGKLAGRRVGQVIDNEVFLSCDGAAEYPLSAGSTAEIRLSDQIVQLVTFSRADQFQAIDQKLRSRR